MLLPNRQFNLIGHCKRIRIVNAIYQHVTTLFVKEVRLKRPFVPWGLENAHIFPSVRYRNLRVKCVTLGTVLVKHLLAHYGVQMRVHAQLGFNAQHGGWDEF